MKKRFFGTDGIRGKVGEYPITPEFMLKLGWAVGRVLSKGQHDHIVIGKDTRRSGYMFESVLEAGLAAAGVNVHLVGPMPTPGIAYLTRTFRARAGIVISASHNPHYDNGIKFFSAEGMKLGDELELEIEAQIDRPMTVVSSSHLGRASRIADAAGRYIEFCKSTIPAKHEFSGTKIVVDCAHGASYHIAPPVFEELGATVVKIGAEPDGLNINDGFGSTQPERLRQAVIDEKADLGIALDGDGDRVLMVDHLGEIVDGDELIYIIAKARHDTGQPQELVVGTLMTNLGLEHALAQIGIRLERAAVGDRYVMEMMQARNSLLGGENSGHIICLDRTTTGDAIISALQVLAEMRRTGSSLHALKSGMEKYPQKLVNVPVNKKVDVSTLRPVQDAKNQIEQELGDAGRVLLRPSGTEPLIRVMVEGKETQQVDQMAHQLAEAVGAATA